MIKKNELFKLHQQIDCSDSNSELPQIQINGVWVCVSVCHWHIFFADAGLCCLPAFLFPY